MAEGPSTGRLRPVLRFPPLTALPLIGWFLAFLLIPLAFVVVYSFSSKGTYGGVEFRFTWQQYQRALDPLYLRVLWNSVSLAGLTTLGCLLLGYPLAYSMATARGIWRSLLFVAVVIPFWTNFVVRAYAIKALLAESGPLHAVLSSLGVVLGPSGLGNSSWAVLLGMIVNYLPFMVLPLYVALERFDFQLLEAARDLGASSWQTLSRVLLPLTRPGIVSGCIFVFTPALGEFVIPDLLGGARTVLIGNLITDQFLKTRDWPFGSAISILLLVLVSISLGIYLRYSEEADA
jgi:spermidine/putrescine transport system permease protein